MRYLYAVLFLVIGMIPVALDGDGTFLFIMAIVAAVLVFDKRDWTKSPYWRATK